MKIVIERVYLETETLGSWFLGEDGIFLLAKTMELPWKDNARSISCIPEGTYKMVREAFTVKHPYPHFRILDVPNRSGILVHKITYVKDLRGCIGVGSAFKDLNSDGVPDIIGSTDTLDKLYRSHSDVVELIIRKKQ
jgi:hypothetical protein